jgi:hypothetical protein
MVAYQETIGDSAPLIASKLFGFSVMLQTFLSNKISNKFNVIPLKGKWNITCYSDDNNYNFYCTTFVFSKKAKSIE